MQKFWFLSSIWFRNVSWCDAIKTSMCSKRNVVLSNVYTAINNYLSAKQRFEGASFWRGWYLLITVKTTKQLLLMNVYTWEVLKQTSPFHLKKQKYIFVLSISAARYTSSTLLLTLHYKSSIIWSKLFMSFTTAIDFFVLVAILFLNRKSQN